MSETYERLATNTPLIIGYVICAAGLLALIWPLLAIKALTRNYASIVTKKKRWALSLFFSVVSLHLTYQKLVSGFGKLELRDGVTMAALHIATYVCWWLLQPRGRSRLKPRSSEEFYNSRAWLDLRYRVLRKYGRTCMLCGDEDGEMHVDHIKPRSKYPELELEFSNLQVLCKSCNFGKSNKHEDDFRQKAG